MTYDVPVRREHLDGGRPKAARGCALFLAVEEVLGRELLFVTYDGTIMIRSTRERYGEPARLSPADQARVADAVRLVDSGRAAEVEPFEIVLHVPESSL